MKDRFNKVVRLGDVISMPSYDHGTTLRVVSIHDDVIIVKKCYRGRKPFSIRFSKGPYFPRCDFTIVSR